MEAPAEIASRINSAFAYHRNRNTAVREPLQHRQHARRSSSNATGAPSRVDSPRYQDIRTFGDQGCGMRNCLLVVMYSPPSENESGVMFTTP